MPRANQGRGRPSRSMPERIDASPEQIAEAVLSMPPKKRWRYLEKHGANRLEQNGCDQSDPAALN